VNFRGLNCPTHPLLNTNTGNSLSQQERDELVGRLESGAINRAQAFRAVVEDESFQTREFNRAFVLMQYFGYLRRNPDSAPDTDFSGWQSWLDNSISLMETSSAQIW
jgi:hypothetical protein